MAGQGNINYERLILDVQGLQESVSSLKKYQDELKKMHDTEKQSAGGFDKLKDSISGMLPTGGKLGGLVSSLTPGMVGLASGVGVATVALKKYFDIVGEGLESLKKLEYGIAKTTSIMGSAKTPEMKGMLTEGVRETILKTGESIENTTQALYNLQSAGKGGADAITNLEEASKASIAGFADLNTAVDLGTTASNAWGVSMTEAFDTLQMATVQGKITMAEMNQSLGMVASSAKQSGVSIQETSAAIAIMTLQGVKAPQAMSSLNAFFTELKQPEKIKVLKQLGVEVLDVNGNMRSFTEITKDMAKVKWTDELRASVKFGQESSKAFNILTKSATDAQGNVTSALDAMMVNFKPEQLAGTVGQAFDELNNTSEQKGKLMEAKWNELSMNLAESWKPLSGQVKGTLGEALDSVNEWLSSSEQKSKKAGDAYLKYLKQTEEIPNLEEKFKEAAESGQGMDNVLKEISAISPEAALNLKSIYNQMGTGQATLADATAEFGKLSGQIGTLRDIEGLKSLQAMMGELSKITSGSAEKYGSSMSIKERVAEFWFAPIGAAIEAHKFIMNKLNTLRVMTKDAIKESEDYTEAEKAKLETLTGIKMDFFTPEQRDLAVKILDLTREIEEAQNKGDTDKAAKLMQDRVKALETINKTENQLVILGKQYAHQITNVDKAKEEIFKLTEDEVTNQKILNAYLKEQANIEEQTRQKESSNIKNKYSFLKDSELSYSSLVLLQQKLTDLGYADTLNAKTKLGYSKQSVQNAIVQAEYQEKYNKSLILSTEKFIAAQETAYTKTKELRKTIEDNPDKSLYWRLTGEMVGYQTKKQTLTTDLNKFKGDLATAEKDAVLLQALLKQLGTGEKPKAPGEDKAKADISIAEKSSKDLKDAIIKDLEDIGKAFDAYLAKNQVFDSELGKKLNDIQIKYENAFDSAKEKMEKAQKAITNATEAWTDYNNAVNKLNPKNAKWEKLDKDTQNKILSIAKPDITEKEIAAKQAELNEFYKMEKEYNAWVDSEGEKVISKNNLFYKAAIANNKEKIQTSKDEMKEKIKALDDYNKESLKTTGDGLDLQKSIKVIEEEGLKRKTEAIEKQDKLNKTYTDAKKYLSKKEVEEYDKTIKKLTDDINTYDTKTKGKVKDTVQKYFKDKALDLSKSVKSFGDSSVIEGYTDQYNTLDEKLKALKKSFESLSDEEKEALGTEVVEKYKKEIKDLGNELNKISLKAKVDKQVLAPIQERAAKFGYGISTSENKSQVNGSTNTSFNFALKSTSIQESAVEILKVNEEYEKFKGYLKDALAEYDKLDEVTKSKKENEISYIKSLQSSLSILQTAEINYINQMQKVKDKQKQIDAADEKSKLETLKKEIALEAKRQELNRDLTEAEADAINSGYSQIEIKALEKKRDLLKEQYDIIKNNTEESGLTEVQKTELAKKSTEIEQVKLNILQKQNESIKKQKDDQMALLEENLNTVKIAGNAALENEKIAKGRVLTEEEELEIKKKTAEAEKVALKAIQDKYVEMQKSLDPVKDQLEYLKLSNKIKEKGNEITAQDTQFLKENSKEVYNTLDAQIKLQETKYDNAKKTLDIEKTSKENAIEKDKTLDKEGKRLAQNTLIEAMEAKYEAERLKNATALGDILNKREAELKTELAITTDLKKQDEIKQHIADLDGKRIELQETGKINLIEEKKEQEKKTNEIRDELDLLKARYDLATSRLEQEKGFSKLYQDHTQQQIMLTQQINQLYLLQKKIGLEISDSKTTDEERRKLQLESLGITREIEQIEKQKSDLNDKWIQDTIDLAGNISSIANASNGLVTSIRGGVDGFEDVTKGAGALGGTLKAVGDATGSEFVKMAGEILNAFQAVGDLFMNIFGIETAEQKEQRRANQIKYQNDLLSNQISYEDGIRDIEKEKVKLLDEYGVKLETSLNRLRLITEELQKQNDLQAEANLEEATKGFDWKALQEAGNVGTLTGNQASNKQVQGLVDVLDRGKEAGLSTDEVVKQLGTDFFKIFTTSQLLEAGLNSDQIAMAGLVDFTGDYLSLEEKANLLIQRKANLQTEAKNKEKEISDILIGQNLSASDRAYWEGQKTYWADKYNDDITDVQGALEAITAEMEKQNDINANLLKNRLAIFDVETAMLDNQKERGKLSDIEYAKGQLRILQENLANKEWVKEQLKGLTFNEQLAKYIGWNTELEKDKKAVLEAETKELETQAALNKSESDRLDRWIKYYENQLQIQLKQTELSLNRKLTDEETYNISVGYWKIQRGLLEDKLKEREAQAKINQNTQNYLDYTDAIQDTTNEILDMDEKIANFAEATAKAEDDLNKDRLSLIEAEMDNALKLAEIKKGDELTNEEKLAVEKEYLDNQEKLLNVMLDKANLELASLTVESEILDKRIEIEGIEGNISDIQLEQLNLTKAQNNESDKTDSKLRALLILKQRMVLADEKSGVKSNHTGIDALISNRQTELGIASYAEGGITDGTSIAHAGEAIFSPDATSLLSSIYGPDKLTQMTQSSSVLKNTLLGGMNMSLNLGGITIQGGSGNGQDIARAVSKEVRSVVFPEMQKAFRSVGKRFGDIG